MVHKKLVKDSRITFTIRPDIEKKVRAKVTKEKETLSGVIGALLEGWLSGAPLPGRREEPITSSSSSVDIELMKREILEELKKEISTGERGVKAPGPVQSSLVHTGMNQSIEAPTSPDNDENHTFIPPEKDTAPSKGYEGGQTEKPTQEERENLSDDIKKFMIEFSPIIKEKQAEKGIKKRDAEKELFGFNDSEVSTMKEAEYSMTWKQYTKYQTLMAEARKKYVLV